MADPTMEECWTRTHIGVPCGENCVFTISREHLEFLLEIKNRTEKRKEK